MNLLFLKYKIDIKKLLIFLSVLTLIISSCKTVPAPESMMDTMLIIPIEIEKENSRDWFGKYRISITDASTKEIVVTKPLPIRNSYTIITGLEPGKYYISKDQFVYDSSKRLGSSVDTKINFELFLNRITVLNKEFIYRMKENKHMDRRWDYFSSEKKTELLEVISDYGNFDLWDNDYIKPATAETQ